MSISKRDFLALGAAAGASMALPAWAQGKPLFDTLNMFVPAAPGGGWDGTARSIERAAKAAGLVVGAACGSDDGWPRWTPETALNSASALPPTASATPGLSRKSG